MGVASRSAFCVLSFRRTGGLGQLRTGKILAVGGSCAAAVLLVFLAAWMILGNGAGPAEPNGIQIIAPVAGGPPESTGPPGVATPASTPVAEAPPRQIAVYITGEVVSPGVYAVSQGKRLDEVLRLAGGPTAHADLSRINLAAYATDAGHYIIPTLGETGESPGFTNGVPGTELADPVSSGCEVPLDINTADAECLETLPGIGSVRADSIVSHREQAGPFASPQAITEVSGIGDGIYKRIADLITVSAH